MATNGICSIRVKGTEHPLYFGMLAIEEVSSRLGDNPSSNLVKIVTDMVYGGMCNHAFRNDRPFPTYESVADLVEELFDEEDSNEQYMALDTCFRESKHGSKWMQKMEELKKKVMELTEQKAETMEMPESIS